MKRRWTSVGLVTAALLLVLTVGLSQAQEPDPPDGPSLEDFSIAATVGEEISYQGTLTEGGTPVDGSRTMVFNLYSDSGCSTLVATFDAGSVPVTDGLFDVALTVDQGDFDGQALWLEVEVSGTGVGCEEILPVPYALSLRPGATIRGTPGLTGALVEASTEDGTISGSLVQGLVLTGAGVYGESGSSLSYGVYGANTAGGYAGFFSGDVGQGNDDDGLVKAAASVYCAGASSSMNYSFNHNSSSTTVSSGSGAAGECVIDFNFDLTDRYWTATAVDTLQFVACDLYSTYTDRLRCQCMFHDGNGYNSDIMVIVY